MFIKLTKIVVAEYRTKWVVKNDKEILLNARNIISIMDHTVGAKEDNAPTVTLVVCRDSISYYVLEDVETISRNLIKK